MVINSLITVSCISKRSTKVCYCIAWRDSFANHSAVLWQNRLLSQWYHWMNRKDILYYININGLVSIRRHAVTWSNGDLSSTGLSLIHCQYSDVIMSPTVYQITSLTIVYSTVYSGTDKKKISKLRVTGFCEGNSLGTREFFAQRASNAENVDIWWRHHGAENTTNFFPCREIYSNV